MQLILGELKIVVLSFILLTNVKEKLLDILFSILGVLGYIICSPVILFLVLKEKFYDLDDVVCMITDQESKRDKAK